MIIVSAGDAITAKLIQEAGFDGIWVSGFETSARLGLPDNGSITMTEMLNEAKKIVNAVDLPVYVDIDTGYGNLTRTVKEFERIGVTGVCVEDNVFPKTNSLFGGNLPLEDMVLHGDRLAKAREVSNIEIIARTEALIRGYSMREALKRAGFYRGSGANWTLIHSRDTTGVEALAVADAIDGHEIKLVTIPTKFPHITCKELYKAGYSMIVWANHTERVKIKAIRKALKKMKTADCPLPVEGTLAVSLEDLKGLTQ